MFTKDKIWSLLIIVLGLLILVPLTATSPQESDGAEIAYQAMIAGVLHPPGFPLYSLISIPLVSISPFNPYHTLALFSVVCQVLATVVLFRFSRLFLNSHLLSAVIALAWLFFPATFRTATDCEVFALNNLLIACIAYCTFTILKKDKASFFILGLVGGLAWSNHIISVLFIPLVLWTLYQKLNKKNLIKLTAGTIIGLSPYLYLIYRIYNPHPEQIFPLANFSDFFDYVLRAGYGTMSLKAGSDINDISYLSHIIELISWNAPFFLISSVVIIVLFLKDKKYSTPIILTLLLNIWFASKLIYPDDVNIYGELLMRFYPTVLIAFLISTPIVLKQLINTKLDIYFFTLLFFLPIAYQFQNKFQAANAAEDKTVDIEIKRILEELPPKAVFISELDRLSLGIPYYQNLYEQRSDISIVIPGMLSLENYRKRLAKKIFGSGEFKKLEDLVAQAINKNVPIHSYQPKQNPQDFNVLPYGITWKWYPKNKEISLESILIKQYQFCSGWPRELAWNNNERHNSQAIRELVFLNNFILLEDKLKTFPEAKNIRQIINFFRSNQIQKAKQICMERLKLTEN